MQSFEIKFEDDKALYRAYMPFVKEGGIFIRTDVPLNLGDSVSIKLTLPDGVEFAAFETDVIWITPVGVEHDLPVGIGVRITGSDAIRIQGDIEHILTKFIKSKDPTDTL